MTIEIFLSQIAIILLYILLTFLIKNFLPKYFEAKGTNQATKEDIGEITKIVEEIKTNLSKETELLKAHISLNNQHRLNIKSAERDALIDLNKKGSSWLYSLVRFDFSSYNESNYDSIEREKEDFKNRKYEYDLAQANLNLFMHDQPLLELIHGFSKAILRYEYSLLKGILEVKQIFGTKNILLESANPNILKIQEEFNLNFLNFYDKYNEESSVIFLDVNKEHAKLVKVLQSRFKEIENEIYNS